MARPGLQIFAGFTDEEHTFVFTIGKRFDIDRRRITIAKINASDFPGDL